MPRLKELYKEKITPKLRETLGLANPMLVPRLQKVVVNMGFGIVEKDEQKTLLEDLTKITGQRPMTCKARKSISNFKLREGMVIGAKVTLRKDRRYEFLDRLITIALPRVRDFRGLKPTSFDGRGNYAMGVKEQTMFPEIDYDAIDAVRGMDIIVTTSAKTDQEAYALLEAFGFPFSKDGNPFITKTEA